MKYEHNGKTYTINDTEIDSIMEKMEDISIAEACEMYLFDHDLIDSEEVDEMTAKVNKNRILSTIHGAKGEKKARKPREKKENPLKKEIILALFKGIVENISTDGEVLITNTEKYIDFNVNDRYFTVNLVEHRKKKG